MTYNLRPSRGNVIVKVADRDTLTASGIVVVEGKPEGPVKGTVLAVGSGRIDGGVSCPVDVAVDDTVWYVQGKGVKVGRGEDELVIAEDNIVALERDGEVIPYWDKALVELVKEESTSNGGVILIADTENGYDLGKVLSVGPGYIKKGFRIPTELAKGDSVFFNQYMGVEVEPSVDDVRRLFLVREYDVYCTIA